MKTQSPTSVAYNYICNNRHASYRPIKVDRRTTFGKSVLAEYNRLRNSVNISEIQSKQRQRRANKVSFTNILSNPLVRDWKSNKGRYGFKIASDRIIEGSRNHWAKSETDKRILSILAGN